MKRPGSYGDEVAAFGIQCFLRRSKLGTHSAGAGSEQKVRRIQPGDEKTMENIARYIVRASFSRERMTFIPEELKIIYQSKDGKAEKVFDAL